MPWGAIGGALVGGLINSNSQSKANAANMDWNKNRLKYTVADAKNAGLHPLAALGASGAGSTIGMVGDTSAGDAITNAGAAISNARANKKAEALNEELIKAQINSTNAQANYYNSQAVDQATTFPVKVNDFISQSAAASDLNRDNQRQQLDFANMPINVHQGTSNAGDFEERYGEILGSIMGAGVAFVDAISIANEYFEKPRNAANKWLEEKLGFGQKLPIWKR